MTGERPPPETPTPPGLTLRSYRPDDLAAVVELHVRSFAALGRDTHSAEQIAGHTALIRDARYADDLERSHLSLAVARDDLIATAGWLPMNDEAATARIRKVFVEPTMARRGIASWLVRHAEREAAAAGRRRYFVRANLNAVPLYRRLGYRAIRPGAMETPTGPSLPVLFMRKDEAGAPIR
jgi:GNAT superfamily N-acetyltransferase